MPKRLAFFGLISPRAPMESLEEHYSQLAQGMGIIRQAVEFYIYGSNQCPEFEELTEKIDAIEDHADKIKRNIRNHLPRRLLMPVDKTLFLNYTRWQDNVLDEAQEALHWLGMRQMKVPEQFQKPILELVDDVATTGDFLELALRSTIGLVHADHLDREGCKKNYHKVRRRRQKVMKEQRELLSVIYNSDMEFKDIYQLIHFIGCLNEMVKNCETCTDTLRAMIAR